MNTNEIWKKLDDFNDQYLVIRRKLLSIYVYESSRACRNKRYLL